MAGTPLILRIGAFGAVVATIMLIVIVILPWPFTFSFPGEEIITGKRILDAFEWAHYLNLLKIYYMVDNIFVIGWIIGWIGLSVLIYTRVKIIGGIVLMFGLLGAFFDFTENEIFLSLLKNYQFNVSAYPFGLIVWNIIREWSYLLPFSGASIAAMGLWSNKFLDRMMSLIGTIYSVIALSGLYIKVLYPLTYIWFLLWFSGSACLLWRRAAKWPSNNENGRRKND